MKKLMIFILTAVMAIGFGGTALAANTVELNVDGGVSNVYWGPSFSTATGGASLYVVGGSILNNVAAKGTQSATTLYAISNTLTNTAGTELLKMQLITDTNISGSTPIGGPQLVSGTSDTVILYVLASPTHLVNSQPESGNTLLAINGGTGAVYWATGIPCTGFSQRGEGTPASDVFEESDAGGTFYCTAPVTIDTSNYSDTSGGATIFGVSSATSFGSTPKGTGVSVWAIDADTGAFTTNSAGNSNVTGFPFIAGSAGSGISVVHAAPVVSGSSLFIIGYGADGGNTIYGLLKDNLLGGVTEALINGSAAADLSDQWMPTPCVTGGSIFVVDNDGGVTSFDTQGLTRNYASLLVFGSKITTGVTAGPVTDGTYIVFSGTSWIRCAKVDNVSTADASGGVSKEWEYDFGITKSIWATPAIVGQSGTTYVFVSVNDTTANTAATYRFTLTDTYQGAPTIVRAHGKLVYASPIVVEDDLWTVSYNPAVDKLENIGVSGLTYWPQFKFDAAKTGANLYTPSAAAAAEDADDADSDVSDDDAEAAYVPGSSGGCFISTIK